MVFKIKNTMAKYDIAYELTGGFEGGFSDVPGDNGGYTYCGITEKNYPSWPYWSDIRSKNPKHNQVFPELHEAVKEFYKKEFWDKIHGDDISSQSLANQIYDTAVNAGISRAISLAQQSLGVAVTGKINNEMLNALKGEALI